MIRLRFAVGSTFSVWMHARRTAYISTSDITRQIWYKLIRADLNNTATVGASFKSMGKHQRNPRKIRSLDSCKQSTQRLNNEPGERQSFIWPFTVDRELLHDWQFCGEVSILTQSDGKLCSHNALNNRAVRFPSRTIQMYDMMKYENCLLCCREAKAAISQCGFTRLHPSARR